MELSTKPILPGSFVVVKDTNSIYRGYKGFVQRVTKKRAAVLFEGGNWDKLITFQLKNFKVHEKTDKQPKLKKEEFHLLELINLKVNTLENDELKTIGEVINLENEKNNLLIIKLFKNHKKVLIPFVEEIVPLVDIKNNFLMINPPKGLLEL